MKTFLLAILTAGALAAPLTVAAKAKVACDDVVSQMEANECIGDEYGKADASLNAAYKKALAFTQKNDMESPVEGEPTETETLKKAQRAWIQFRDAHCAGMGFKARGGTLEPYENIRCQLLLTKERSAQLKELIRLPGQ
ncbi:lysozyme inhibitor LprI family protein [Rhizobium sp. FKL33]|uniref:lysozyme inhibitor LprI family protein n=1 Tax=Rhizobium sp. FKL33 TaxID=2562307 RepID=UPI001484F84B|nr:lysozyme inhibitor LprI family protein [Rhizobium sp. FKL33]